MPSSSSLHETKTKKGKNDHLYTRLADIEKELKYYREHFKGKTVYCNCDDPYESNFFKYFIRNFNVLGLKKLITTCYAGSPVAGTKLNLDFSGVARGVAHKIEITAVNERDGLSIDDIEEFLKSDSPKKKIEKLNGDGDFRSEECIELLKEADIVVTFPPPSLFSGYVTQLFEHKKDFIILGSGLACSSSVIFPRIKENKLWIGPSIPNKSVEFDSFDHGKDCVEIEMAALWYTTLDHGKRHENLILYETYSPEKYPKYDNYDAIEVGKVAEVPKDYNGIMGVPQSFLIKYNPDQFEILACTKIRDQVFVPKVKEPTLNGEGKHVRIFIRKKR